MIIRSVADVVGTPRDVHGAGWKSRRLVLAGEGADYSLHETTLDAGVRLRFEYERHRETVYCVEGEGTLDDLGGGRVVSITPGSLYSAGIGEAHVITAHTELKLVCVFTPALDGAEEAD
jgi:L-ectoine synthase